ncbi:MAG: Uncharacterized MFS-type transporter, partial [uncultured Solirubrobacteraceae bacterium]
GLPTSLPEAPRARRRDHGLLGRGARRDGGQRRAAGDRAGPRRRPRGAAVGLQRLPADPRLAHPRRRLARRPVRGAPDLRAGRRGLRRGLAGLRALAEHRGADRLPRAAGRLRSAADAERAGAHRGGLLRRGARGGDRDLDRVGRDRDGAGAGGRRLPHRRRRLALDLRHQRSARHGHPGADLRGGPGAARGRRPRAGRLGRGIPLRPRPGGPGVRAHPAARERVGEPGGAPPGPRRHRDLRAVPRLRAAREPPHARALPLLPAQLRGRQRPDLRDVRRALRAVLLPRPVPAAGRGLRGPRGGPRDAAHHDRDVRPLEPDGPAGRPPRPPLLHGRRPAAGRCRARAHAAPRRRRRLPHRPAARAAGLLARALDDGRAADRNGARRRRRAQRRDRVRDQQRHRAGRRPAGHRGARRGDLRPVRLRDRRPPRRRAAVGAGAGGGGRGQAAQPRDHPGGRAAGRGGGAARRGVGGRLALGVPARHGHLRGARRAGRPHRRGRDRQPPPRRARGGLPRLAAHGRPA